MKFTIIVITAVLTLAMIACSNKPLTDLDVQNTRNAQFAGKVPTVSPIDATYRSEVAGWARDMQVAFGRVGELAGSAQVTSSQWRGDMQAAMITVQNLIARFRRLSPPPGFERFHEQVLRALDFYERASSQYQRGLQAFDASLIASGTQLPNQGTAELEKAPALLPK